MGQNSTRILIMILALFTATVHLVILNIGPYGVQTIFLLNGLGYLTLIAAFLFKFPKGQERLVHYAFMAYVFATIIAWVVYPGTRDLLGYSTKTVEVLLIAFLWMDLQRLPAAKKS